MLLLYRSNTFVKPFRQYIKQLPEILLTHKDNIRQFSQLAFVCAKLKTETPELKVDNRTTNIADIALVSFFSF